MINDALWKRMTKRGRRRHMLNVKTRKLNNGGKCRIKKHQFIEAMKGTRGIKSKIAENLGCKWQTVNDLLSRHDWMDVAVEYANECEMLVDDARETVRIAVNSHHDIQTAAMNARWVLQHRDREHYGEETKVIHEGGKNPIKTEVSGSIPLDALDLPIEIQRAVLAALDEKERKEKEAREAAEAEAKRAKR